MKRPSRKILIVLPVAVIVCALFAFSLWYGLFYDRCAADIQKEIDLFIAEGGSLNLADLAPKNLPELVKNAKLFKKAVSKINYGEDKYTGGYKSEVDFGDAAIPENDKILRAIYEFNFEMKRFSISP